EGARMDQQKERSFRPIGSLLPICGSTPQPMEKTQTAPPRTSVTGGMPKPVRTATSEAGLQHGAHGFVEPRSGCVQTVTQSNLPSRSSMRELSERLRREKSVAVLVTRLLAHYWTADDPPVTRQGQIEDWIEDLVEFPAEYIEEATREWRRSQVRRPMPADIRRLTIEWLPSRMRPRTRIADHFEGCRCPACGG